jgi:hypothetical protein
MADTYDGPVVFVEGVHYPATQVESVEGEDDRVHADITRPLRWDNGSYRDATGDEPLHNDANHQADLELEVGGE